MFLFFQIVYEKSSACFLKVWSTDIGARLGGGGLRHAPQLVPGRGGVAPIESFTPKFQTVGEPGREMTVGGTSEIMSFNVIIIINMINDVVITRCLVGFIGGVESIMMGPICLIR